MVVRKISGEKGITLIELLAVIAIGGILIVLVISIFNNGQNQYSTQTTKVEQLTDIRYAAKVITKEIRKAEKVKVNKTGLELGTSPSIVFSFSSNEILQNGSTLVSGIEGFSVVKEDRTLQIKIVSSKQKGNNKSIETEIFIREGVMID